jgi:hypothetical protein
VFVSKSGSKIVFESYYSESAKVPAKYNGVNFTFDTFQADLQSISPEGMTIGLYGSANFNTTDSYIKSLLIHLMPLNPEYATNSIMLNDKNEFIEKERWSGYSPQMTFNGKVFKDVYTSYRFEKQTAFAQISFNTEFGVVSFLDKQNDLYVFDRFE